MRPSSRFSTDGPREVVTDKGYHSRALLSELTEWGLHTYCSEPNRGRQRWRGQEREPTSGVCESAAHSRRERPPAASQRGEKLERWYQHLYDRGGMRGLHLRGLAGTSPAIFLPCRPLSASGLCQPDLSEHSASGWFVPSRLKGLSSPHENSLFHLSLLRPQCVRRYWYFSCFHFQDMINRCAKIAGEGNSCSEVVLSAWSSVGTPHV
jgi:hypothetical protein